MPLALMGRMSTEPVVYHGCVRSRSNDDFSSLLDAVRVNGNVPLVSLNPPTNRVSNASVFHRDRLMVRNHWKLDYCACFLPAMCFKYATISPISLSLRWSENAGIAWAGQVRTALGLRIKSCSPCGVR